MTKSELHGVKPMSALIDSLAKNLDPSQIEFLRARWLHQINYWDRWSRDAKRKYFALRALVVVGGVSVPVVLTLQVRAFSPYYTVIAAVIGALVAAAAAWEGVVNYGQTWLVKCRWTELLKIEGFLFMALTEKYKGLDRQAAFVLFASEVERLIGRELGDYVASFDFEKLSKELAQLTLQVSDLKRNDALRS